MVIIFNRRNIFISVSDNDNDVNLKFLSPANYSRHQESHFTKASGCSFLTALGKSSYGRG